MCKVVQQAGFAGSCFAYEASEYIRRLHAVMGQRTDNDVFHEEV